MTADGYFAAADGNLEWVVPDPKQVEAAVEAIPRFDTILFGRKTYELLKGFWKNAVDDALTAPDPHHPGPRTREHGTIGIWLIEPNARIVLEWPGYSGPTTVEWRFAPQENGTTFVSVTESGFSACGDELVKYVADSTQGFTLMLAGHHEGG